MKKKVFEAFYPLVGVLLALVGVVLTALLGDRD